MTILVSRTCCVALAFLPSKTEPAFEQVECAKKADRRTEGPRVVAQAIPQSCQRSAPAIRLQLVAALGQRQSFRSSGPAANSNHQCRPPAVRAYSEWRRHASRSGRLCRHFAGCQGDAVIFQLDVLRSRDPAVGPTHWLGGSSWREEARSSPAAPRSSVEHTEGFDIAIVSPEPPAGLRGLERRDPATGDHICPCKRLKVSRNQGTASASPQIEEDPFKCSKPTAFTKFSDLSAARHRPLHTGYQLPFQHAAVEARCDPN
jgi:hypothetical protein